MRVFAAIAVLAAVLASASPADAAQADLDRARKAANQAAAEYAAAQTKLSDVEADIIELKARTAAASTKLSALQSLLRDAAIEQYLRGRADGPDVDLGFDLAAARRKQTLASYFVEGAGDAIDQYKAIAEDLDIAQQQLADRQKEAKALTERMKERIAATQAELAKLQKLEAERVAREKAAAAKAAAAAAAAAAKASTGVQVTGSWTCPVQGPRAFSNDWGDPRGGGRRRHQGTDILAPRGTPVVASVSGTVKRHDSSAGGISYYLMGDDGIEYFGAHLNSYVGGTGRVGKGETIGYVGNSGNARGGPPHLHFEIHPGGGAPVNPYNTVRQYC